MQLFYSPASPYARLVRVVIRFHDLLGQIEEVETHPFNNEAKLEQANPLVKVPALVFADGRSLIDSEVIVSYIDQEFGDGKLMAAYFEDHFYRSDFATVKGLVDAAVLLQCENYRELQEGIKGSAFFKSRYIAAITRSLEYFTETLDLSEGPRDGILDYFLVIALQYLEFRHKVYDFSDQFRELYLWQASVAQSACFQATEPST